MILLSTQPDRLIAVGNQLLRYIAAQVRHQQAEFFRRQVVLAVPFHKGVQNAADGEFRQVFVVLVAAVAVFQTFDNGAFQGIFYFDV